MTSLFKDTVKSAAAVNLLYISDKDPGITREKKNNDFVYLINGTKVTDKEIISRIKNLVLPPAWQQVWICATDHGHLQATGIDTKKRKQYKYHPLWNALLNQTKFTHLYEFGKALPAIRAQLQKDFAKHGLPLQKVLAAIISIMQYTWIRVGNSQYEKLYGSFGLTTLKDKHVSWTL